MGGCNPQPPLPTRGYATDFSDTGLRNEHIIANISAK